MTCGATRSAIALLHGDFLAALKLNPMIFVALWAVVIFDLYAAAVLVSGAARLRFELANRTERWRIVAALFVLAGLNWVYLLRTQ